MDDLNATIHFVKENAVISLNSRSSEKLMHGIKVLMAKNYVENLGEEAKKGMREKAEQGNYPSMAPIGYRNVECDKRRFIQPDPETAAIVRRVFELYATGAFSVQEVAKRARQMGLCYKKSASPVQKATVFKVPNNPLYYGDFLWNGVLHHGNHEAIITKDLFDRVQEVLHGKSGHASRRNKYDWPFRGLVRCGQCGCAMSAERKKGKYVYYRCTGAKGKCPDSRAKQEVLNAQFTEALRRMQVSPEVLVQLVAALRDSHADEKRYHTVAIAGLQEEYAQLQNRIDIAFDHLLDGLLTRPDYECRITDWRAAQSELRGRIEAHERANTSYLEEGVRLLEFAQRAADVFLRTGERQKRELLNFVLSNSSWRGGRLHPEYRKPFDLLVFTLSEAETDQKEKAASLAESGQNQFWLAYGGSTRTLVREEWVPRLRVKPGWWMCR